MKNSLVKKISIGILSTILLCTSSNSWAQPILIEPGDKSLNTQLIKTGDFEWGWFQDERSDIGKVLVSIRRNDNEIIIQRYEASKKLGTDETTTIVLDANNLAPKSNKFVGDTFSYDVKYSDKITGTRTSFANNPKASFSEKLEGKYFDIDSVPFIISNLPLSKDYRANIPVVDFSEGFKPKYSQFKITEVTDFAGHDVTAGTIYSWKVTAVNKALNYEHVIYIDKQSRRILRDDYRKVINGWPIAYNYFDRFKDVSPIKAKFDTEYTMALLTKGNSTIKGQAYAKSFKVKGAKKETQYAQKGSEVLLIPLTPYFKEWVDYNIKMGAVKKGGGISSLDQIPSLVSLSETYGLAYPLPPEVQKAMLYTKVSDDKGNFAYKNIKPGEYLVFVSFNAMAYDNTTSQNDGYNISIGGDGTAYVKPINKETHWLSKKVMKVHKQISVRRDGETISETFTN